MAAVLQSARLLEEEAHESDYLDGALVGRKYPNVASIARVSQTKSYSRVHHQNLEMEQAVQLLQRHSTVVVDMALLDDSSAQRFIDFLSGAVWSLDGSIQRVSDEVIVAAPMAIRLTSGSEAEPEI